jgi:hypothetical protein
MTFSVSARNIEVEMTTNEDSEDMEEPSAYDKLEWPHEPYRGFNGQN